VTREDGRDIRHGLDPLQRFVESRSVTRQVLASPRPFADDGGEKIERAQVAAAKAGRSAEDVGKKFPVTMQPRPRARADAFLHRFVGVGLRTSAPGSR